MRVYVGNLPVAAGDAEVEEIFTVYGTVDFAVVVVDPQTGQSMGFGYVEMPVEAEAKAAIEGLNGSTFMGNTIKVHEVQV